MASVFVFFAWIAETNQDKHETEYSTRGTNPSSKASVLCVEDLGDATAPNRENFQQKVFVLLNRERERPLRQRQCAYYNASVMQPEAPLEQENLLPPTERKATLKESIWDFIKFAFLAVIIVIPIRLFIAQPFVVSGASMVPTFESGHYLIIDELSYRFEKPKRGEVIVFRLPAEQSKFLIKRIVGLPGETVELSGNDIRIKNESHPDGFLWEQGAFNKGRDGTRLTVVLSADEYFVLGDNRGESADSRIWGALPRELIVGRPLVRLLPLSQIALFPGEWK